MAAPLTYVSIILAFFVVVAIMPRWIATALRRGFAGRDLNKRKKIEVAEAGGLCVVLGFVVGSFAYIGFLVFYYNVSNWDVLFSFAAATTVLLAGLIGFVDDVLGWRAGIRQIYKVLLTLFIPIPIMVLNAGNSIMSFPFIGELDFGILFPLILVPIAIIGTTNGFNMLAGYNGLEAGLGVLILSTLGLISYLENNLYIAGICATMTAALLAFLLFNKYPARVFPGDTLTYSVGALIGVVAILGNMEKFALILFVPYFCELVLKARPKFQKASWANEQKDGSLKNKYGKWYGLPNVAISFLTKLKKKAYEWEVVILVWTFEAAFVAIALLSYYGYLPI